jgi:hypothetical protein
MIQSYARKNPTALYVCHGTIHDKKQKYTLDIRQEAKPLILADITNKPDLKRYYKHFDKAILEYCPFHVYATPNIDYEIFDDAENGNYFLVRKKDKKRVPVYFKPNLQTFLNIYQILKKDGLVYIPNWYLIEMYTTEKNIKNTISNFLKPIKGLFKFKNRIQTSKSPLDITLILQKI